MYLKPARFGGISWLADPDYYNYRHHMVQYGPVMLLFRKFPEFIFLREFTYFSFFNRLICIPNGSFSGLFCQAFFVNAFNISEYIFTDLKGTASIRCDRKIHWFLF
jgi:hypothetical protein